MLLQLKISFPLPKLGIHTEEDLDVHSLTDEQCRQQWQQQNSNQYFKTMELS